MPDSKHSSIRILIAITLVLFGSLIQADENLWIAGLDPATRPINAPTITTVQHSAIQRAQALNGVSAPIPESLDFLDDQGNWYTPFSKPGMAGPYDIRGWHSRR